MPPTGDKVSFRLKFVSTAAHATPRPSVPLSVGPDVYLERLFEPTAPRSSISPRVLQDLKGRGLVPQGGRRFVLRDLRIEGQLVPDLEVRLGLTATFFQFDGGVGADFLRHFAEIHVDLRTLVVTLTRA